MSDMVVETPRNIDAPAFTWLSGKSGTGERGGGDGNKREMSNTGGGKGAEGNGGRGGLEPHRTYYSYGCNTSVVSPRKVQ